MTTVKKYLSILNVELRDTGEDLVAALAIDEVRAAKGEISNYVFKSNASVFHKEIASIAEIINEMHCCTDKEYASVDALEKELDAMVQKAITTYDYPQVVLALVRRKMQKVRNYLL